jgi:hypothetical protein
VAALALGLYNDFAIRQRVAHSFGDALPSGLQVDRCRRVTSLTMQSKNFFDCTLRSAKHAGVPYRLEIHGRCWHALRLTSAPAAPQALNGCLSPLELIAKWGS